MERYWISLIVSMIVELCGKLCVGSFLGDLVFVVLL